MDRSDDHLMTFLWDRRSSAEMTDEYIQAAIDRKDPHQIFFRLFRAIRDASMKGEADRLRQALTSLDFVMNDYSPAERLGDGIRFRYGYGHGKLPSGWWSGMDGFLAPLTMFSAWEITGVDRYRKAAIATAKLAIQSPEQGGSLWREDSGCWVSEYSWTGMTMQDEYQVLNGHLYGLHALLLLAKATDDETLVEAAECAVKGTKNRNFVRRDGKWTWYQLTPPVIAPSGYMLFEAAEFKSLFNETGDRYFLEQAEIRNNLYAQQFPVSAEKRSDDFRLTISTIGAPHPYLPISRYRADCSIGSKVVSLALRRTYDEEIPLLERLTASVDTKQKPDFCRLYEEQGDADYLIFTQKEFPEDSPEPQRLELPTIVDRGATSIADGEILIDPKLKAPARITFDLPSGWDEHVLAFAVSPPFHAGISMYLVDDSNKIAKRAYPMIKADCDNLIFLSQVGFENEEGLGQDGRKLVVQIDIPEDAAGTIKISDYVLLTNSTASEAFIRKHQDGCYRQKTLID